MPHSLSKDHKAHKAQHIAQKYRNRFIYLKKQLGKFAQKSVADAAKAYDCSPQLARYWKKKVSLPNFRTGTHGGARCDISHAITCHSYLIIGISNILHLCALFFTLLYGVNA